MWQWAASGHNCRSTDNRYIPSRKVIARRPKLPVSWYRMRAPKPRTEGVAGSGSTRTIVSWEKAMSRIGWTRADNVDQNRKRSILYFVERKASSVAKALPTAGMAAGNVFIVTRLQTALRFKRRCHHDNRVHFQTLGTERDELHYFPACPMYSRQQINLSIFGAKSPVTQCLVECPSGKLDDFIYIITHASSIIVSSRSSTAFSIYWL